MKNENVVCVPVAEMKGMFGLDNQSWKVTESDLNRLNYQFIPRSEAEENFEYKQLIPYAIVKNKEGKIFIYQRCGSEKRLANLFSVGIGGHVNDKDGGDCLFSILLNGLKREFEEEIGVSLNDCQIKFLGMINEEQTEVGHCHTGIVFQITLNSESLQFDSEIGNPQWKDPNSLDLSKFELWSSLALKLMLDNSKSE